MADNKETPSIKELEEILSNQEKLNKLSDEDVKKLKEKLNVLMQITDIMRDEELPFLEKKIAQAKALIDYETDLKKKKDLQSKINKDEYELAQKNLALAVLKGNVDDKEIEKLEEKYKKAKEAYELEQKSQDSKKQGLETLTKTLGVLNNMIGTYGQAIIQQFTLNGLISTFGGFVSEVIDAQRQLAAETGKIDLLSPEKYQSSTRELSKYAVGFKELAAAMGTLDNSFAAFSNLQPNVQQQIAGDAAALSNLGISVESQGKLMQEFGRGIGMTATQAASQIKTIAVEAERAGISPKKAIADLGTSFGQLSSHGANAGKVFIELQRQSKELGVEVGTMLGIVGKGFDTFDGAAEKAGKLNAMLGGDYLNSVEMLNATESERVDIMRQAFTQSGKNWDQMDRFEKKSIAAILGAKDEAEARKMLGQVSIEEQLRLKSEADAQKQLEDAQKASADTMRLLQLSLSDFMVIAKPVAETIRSMVQWLAEHRTTAMVAATAIIALTAAFKALSLMAGIVEFIANLNLSFGTLSKTAEPAGKSIGTSLKEIGVGAAQGAVGLLAVGGAIALIGLGVGLAAAGLSLLVASFGNLKGEQITAAGLALLGFGLAVGLLVAGLIYLAPEIAIAGIALYYLGGAIALVGLGVGVAAAGMSILVDSIAKIVTGPAAGAGAAFKDIAVGIAALGAAIAAFSAGSVFSLFTGGTSGLVNAVKSIKEAMQEIPVNDTAFNARVESMKTISHTLTVAKDISSEQIKPAKEFINSAKEYYQAQINIKTSDNEAMMQAMLKAASVSQTAARETTSSGKEIPVILRIENGPDLIAYVHSDKGITFGRKS